MMTYQNLSPDSKVWIYQSSRLFTDKETGELCVILEKFADEWAAHGKNLSAYATVQYKRFIVLMVDESAAGASGCSIDKSVHFMQEVEKHYGIELFNRLNLAYLTGKGDDTALVHKSKISELIENQTISESTTVFNNLIKTKHDFEHSWKIPLVESWAGPALSSK